MPLGQQITKQLGCVFVLSTVLLASSSVMAEPVRIKEHQVKARYLNSFIKFIQWPNEVLPTRNTPIRLCIIGDNPFDRVLEGLIAKYNEQRDTQTHPQEVVYLKRLDDPSTCQLLYISHSEESYLKQILSAVENKPILTVSSLNFFVAKGGGMIQFYKRGNKIRFYINPQALRTANLKADANMLRVADIIE
jgi:hypothetical protein